ncbi:hypothetical protein F8M41_015107 [Gigaspora margarita]|uniref:Uncharacterized protein n=1 Tax=Gigaspora margarita TaxID=4874 RepID=A0A8H3ZWW1_GIGMA|nr:hypothetical protein F8M41_015107 [Gigaspora margarita]
MIHRIVSAKHIEKTYKDGQDLSNIITEEKRLLAIYGLKTIHLIGQFILLKPLLNTMQKITTFKREAGIIIEPVVIEASVTKPSDTSKRSTDKSESCCDNIGDLGDFDKDCIVMTKNSDTGYYKANYIYFRHYVTTSLWKVTIMVYCSRKSKL